MLGDYSDYDQYDEDQFGRQRPFPYNQKFVKKDEETIGEYVCESEGVCPGV